MFGRQPRLRPSSAPEAAATASSRRQTPRPAAPPPAPRRVVVLEPSVVLSADEVACVAAAVGSFDYRTLARCQRVNSVWRAAFGPLLASLPARLNIEIEVLSNSELLRRPMMWQTRRRALVATLTRPSLHEVRLLQSPPHQVVAEVFDVAMRMCGIMDVEIKLLPARR